MKRLPRLALKWLFLVTVLSGCYVVFAYICYSVPNLAYKKLNKLKPGTRQEVETVLPWSRRRFISNEESPFWPEQLMGSSVVVRYTIFSLPGADIDVVYDKDEKVLTWFGTYE